MKILLEMNFQTDGDFCFRDMDQIINTQSPMYNNTVKEFSFNDGSNYDDIYIHLECEGEPNPCRWAIRDLSENLIRNGIKTVHYWLVKDLYEFIIFPIENLLWSEKDVNYYNTLDGNYCGTYITLQILHEYS